MKTLRRITVSLALLLPLASSYAEGIAPNTDGIFQAGEWKYQLLVLRQGTSEQQTIGQLSFRGKEVNGGPFFRIVTDLGHFMWSPFACEAARCGWYRIDPTKLYSRWTIVKIDESEPGPIWHPVEAKAP